MSDREANAAERLALSAIESWENEGGAISRRPPRYPCGRRGAWSRSWAVYQVASGPPLIAGLTLHRPDVTRPSMIGLRIRHD